MPSSLTTSVRNAMHKLVTRHASTSGGGEAEHTAIDLYRNLRDEASLLYERQLILDTLDADPFGILRDDNDDDDDDAPQDDDQHRHLQQQLQRAKKLVNVISCTRNTTPDGWCVIDCTVELKKDGVMRAAAADVDDNVRLFFKYERRPVVVEHNHTQHNKDENGSVQSSSSSFKKRKIEKNNDVTSDTTKPNSKKDNGTIPNSSRKPHGKDSTRGALVSYTIHASRDYGEKRPIIIVEVAANSHVGPSVEPAVPMDDGDDDDDEWEDISDEGDNEDGKDHDAIVGTTDTGESQTATKVSHGESDQDAVLDKLIADIEKVRPLQSKQQQQVAEISNTSTATTDHSNADRYAAFADAETLMDFLHWTKLELDETVAIFFLLSFPFYEHEWDIVGFVVDSVLGHGGDEEGESNEEE